MQQNQKFLRSSSTVPTSNLSSILPIPAWILKKCPSVLIPTITNTVDLSLSSGQFHPILKQSTVSPLLKKSTLDKDQPSLSNYRPVSLLYLSSPVSVSLHPFHWNSLAYIHDHHITGSQKISRLCFRDLSAAFDTNGHNILISRLSSWFGIHGSVINWFKYHRSSRSLRVKCENRFSPSHSCLCFGPLHWWWQSVSARVTWSQPQSRGESGRMSSIKPWSVWMDHRSSTSSNWLAPVIISSDIYDKFRDMSAVMSQRAWSRS